MKIGGQGKLHHITGVPAPPQIDDPTYPQWEQDDLIVCSWLLDNVIPDLVHQYVESPTAHDLWDGLAATFGKEKDGIQLFDLICRTNNTKQGTDSLEVLYSKMQGLWRDIDLMDPNRAVCPTDIKSSNARRSETKLYQFLSAVGDEFDGEKRDLLKRIPLPGVEVAYSTIRSERNRRIVMGAAKRTNEPAGFGLGTGLAAQYFPVPNGGASKSPTAFPSGKGGKSTVRNGGVDRNKIR